MTTKMEKAVKIENAPEMENPVKMENAVKMENVVKMENAVKMENVVKMENDVKMENPVKMENAVKVENDIEMENPVKMENAVKVENVVKVENDVKMENAVKMENPVKMENAPKTENAPKVINTPRFWAVSGIPKFTNFGQKLLEDCKTIQPPIVDDKNIVRNIIKWSNEFPIMFPIDSCKVSTQPATRFHYIERQAISTYPLINERVLWLYLKFIEHKSIYGNKIEKEVYKDITLTNFVQRLLDKRAVSFVGESDEFLLLSGEKGNGGYDKIGTEDEKPPLILKNCLSYDEIKLSALLSVSSHSEFLNDGNRENCGVIEKHKCKIERSGVIIGLIGPRLCQPFQMEYQDIIIDKMQNKTENGYGSQSPNSKSDPISEKAAFRKIWNEFYGPCDFLYSNINCDGNRFLNIGEKGNIFDKLMMKKRYTISFDTLLLESQFRAAYENKKAYIHVVGMGLGAWRAAPHQETIFLETFENRIKALLPLLKDIGYIHFSWFNTESGDIKNGGFINCDFHIEGIRILVSKRNPADKLKWPEFEKTLLIVSYAWDGNALPGNEFWLGSLNSSNASSTACSSLIAELHNPHINKKFVNGENLHIATLQYGVMHIADFAKEPQRHSN